MVVDIWVGFVTPANKDIQLHYRRITRFDPVRVPVISAIGDHRRQDHQVIGTITADDRHYRHERPRGDVSAGTGSGRISRHRDRTGTARSLSNAIIPLIWVSRGNAERIETSLDEDPMTDSVRELIRTDLRILYQIEWPNAQDGEPACLRIDSSIKGGP